MPLSSRRRTFELGCKASKFNNSADSPLFPTSRGNMPTKEAVVFTFEHIGEQLGQPLTSAAGLRLFGGHSPRVTGAQHYAALGLEINKMHILARHSGDASLRSVSDAPLKSLRAHLGLSDRGSSVSGP